MQDGNRNSNIEKLDCSHLGKTDRGKWQSREVVVAMVGSGILRHLFLPPPSPIHQPHPHFLLGSQTGVNNK